MTRLFDLGVEEHAGGRRDIHVPVVKRMGGPLSATQTRLHPPSSSAQPPSTTAAWESATAGGSPAAAEGVCAAAEAAERVATLAESALAALPEPALATLTESALAAAALIRLNRGAAGERVDRLLDLGRRHAPLELHDVHHDAAVLRGHVEFFDELLDFEVIRFEAIQHDLVRRVVVIDRQCDVGAGRRRLLGERVERITTALRPRRVSARLVGIHISDRRHQARRLGIDHGDRIRLGHAPLGRGVVVEGVFQQVLDREHVERRRFHDDQGIAGLLAQNADAPGFRVGRGASAREIAEQRERVERRDTASTARGGSRGTGGRAVEGFVDELGSVLGRDVFQPQDRVLLFADGARVQIEPQQFVGDRDRFLILAADEDLVAHDRQDDRVFFRRRPHRIDELARIDIHAVVRGEAVRLGAAGHAHLGVRRLRHRRWFGLLLFARLDHDGRPAHLVHHAGDFVGEDAGVRLLYGQGAEVGALPGGAARAGGLLDVLLGLGDEFGRTAHQYGGFAIGLRFDVQPLRAELRFQALGDLGRVGRADGDDFHGRRH